MSKSIKLINYLFREWVYTACDLNITAQEFFRVIVNFTI